MATVSFSSEQNINISQILVGVFAVMVAAGAFIVLITNMLVGSKVSAISEDFAQQLAAYQNNPVNVQNAAQTNAAPSCTDPSMTTVSPSGSASGVLGASTSMGGTSNAIAWKPGSTKLLSMGSYTYNQSNSSVTNTTSTNTFTLTDNRVDNRWSGNTNNQAWNNGNTTDSGNDNSTTTNTSNTNNQAWNNGNTTNSGNSPVTTTNTTTTTTTNTDLSNNSVNTNTNISDNNNNNGNAVNSGNTTNTDNSWSVDGNTLVVLPVVPLFL